MDTSSVELPVLGSVDEIEHDRFLRLVLRHLSGSLEEVVGLPEAQGFISIVGRRIGDDVYNAYRDRLGNDPSAAEIADILVDFKNRIGGDFFVEEVLEDTIVLGNRACPYGKLVKNRRSLCAMTSNSLGVVAAQAVGVAHVEIPAAIAQEDEECRVVIRLGRDGGSDRGRVFYRL